MKSKSGIPGGAGILNQLCDFERRVFTTTARGGPSEDWVFDFTAKCSFSVPKGLKFTKMGARDIAAEDRKGLNQGTFIVRWREGIGRDEHRIVHKGRAWNIASIREEPDGKRVYLEIDVTEHVEITGGV